MLSTRPVSAKNLPVKKLSALLSERSVAETWRNLLYTHLRHSYPGLVSFFLEDDFFDGATEYAENLLHELSIGNIGVLYEYSLATSDPNSRKESGQYFTPDDVATLMAEKATLDNESVWLDPCSGVGNLTFWLMHKRSLQSNVSAAQILSRSTIVMDRDPLALFIARVLLSSHFWGDYQGNLFKDCEKNFIEQDFLDLKTELPEYDFSILNPPYLRTARDSRFETSSCADLYAYFLERIIKTSKKGFVSITPQSFTNASKFYPLREMMNKYSKSMSIYCFDNVPDSIFRGVKYGSTNTNTANSTRAAITVFYKKDTIKKRSIAPSTGIFREESKEGREESLLKVTPLLRWRTEQRTEMFSMVDSYLSDIRAEDGDPYPKVHPMLSSLYEETRFSPRMSTLISGDRTDHFLSIPSSPRYFTPALKRDVSRSSIKKLYFRSKQDMDYSYIILNSSFFYWWWRAMDGGMTISNKTILSLPLLDFRDSATETLHDATRALEASESENLVFKENAGKSNENVKHPMSLIKRLNSIVLPSKYQNHILGEHMNSTLDR